MARAAALREGSMVAVMGGDDDARRALGALDDVWIANVNGTGQIVVSGTREGLDDLLRRHRELGWRRATPLPVGGAFHSPLMSPAQDEFDEALERARWERTDSLLIANVDGALHVGGRGVARTPATTTDLTGAVPRRHARSPRLGSDVHRATPEWSLDGPHQTNTSFWRSVRPDYPSGVTGDGPMSRHVIVTGASRGIGAAIARVLRRRTATRWSPSRVRPRRPPGCAKSFAVDVSQSSSVNDAVKAATPRVRTRRRGCRQRRGDPRRTGPEDVRRTVARRPRHQSGRRVLHGARGDGLDGACATRLHYLHRLGLAVSGRARTGQLRGRQGRARRPGESAGEGGGVTLGHRERRGPGPHRHRHDRRARSRARRHGRDDSARTRGPTLRYRRRCRVPRQ